MFNVCFVLSVVMFFVCGGWVLVVCCVVLLRLPVSVFFLVPCSGRVCAVLRLACLLMWL